MTRVHEATSAQAVEDQAQAQYDPNSQRPTKHYTLIIERLERSRVGGVRRDTRGAPLSSLC